ncbi:hypothetical protein [Streptomyces marokkonensis]|uniref:hypothetical protein n=1 Tax=Streptomyces marokkonensis TaxID=324855 RepID=UPI0031E61051
MDQAGNRHPRHVPHRGVVRDLAAQQIVLVPQRGPAARGRRGYERKPAYPALEASSDRRALW